MRRIITVAAVAATALIATATAASAVVTYDATNDGVITGHVDKGDIQPVLGWNENKVQTTPVQFSTTFTTFTDKSWTCNNGETRHNVKALAFKQGLTTETLRHQTTNKITGWNLTGLGSLEYVGQTVTGHAWLDCADAGGVNYLTLNTDQRHAIGTDLLVNGLLLPETPVVVEVPAEVPAA
jgi:hypothetical protein